MFLILYCFCYRTMQPKGKRGKAAEPKNNEQNTEGTSSNNNNNNRERKEKVAEVVEDSSHSASLNEQAYRPPAGYLECPSLTPEMSSHEEVENVGNSVSAARFTVDKPCAREAHVVGHSSTSSSFNPAQVINLQKGNEVNSVEQGLAQNMVDKYQVKPVLMPIVKQIISKHGDIFKNCTVVTTKYRSKLLEMICNIIIDLQERKISETNEDHLQDIVLLLDDMKNKNVDVEWLHQRLVEILQAREVLKQTSMLKEKKEFSRQNVENAEKELKEKERDKDGLAILLKAACAEVADCKEKLAAVRDESARIKETIADSESKANRFLNCSLVGDLL
ncbi:hypothetical protein TanjilG_05712 [Lupinus angustifolius]|uniref:Phospholipase-like protein n=1 Tax=Lupinus angustifolius TaxID=3871 RepID=A0A4P1R361_LUPAN|nr:hypothetical protein TanjilG_05712 [Lupinus angustifolius]